MKHLNLLSIAMILSVASFAQPPISGTSSTCVGVATPYTDATTGGTWSVSNYSLATISATGVLIGVAAGVDTVIYTVPPGAFVVHTVTINPPPCPIMGVATVCAGGTTLLTDCLGGGVWSSAAPAIISISGAGVVTGVASGTAIITYADAAGCFVTISVGVSSLPTPFPVTGGGSYCIGGAGVNVGLAGSATGINYQLYCGGVAVGAPVAGTGTTLSFGLQTVVGVYTVVATNVTTGCTNNMTFSATVSTVPLPSSYTVTGGGSYCAGGGSGSVIGLSSSDVGVSYTLDSDGVAVLTITGTGSSLTFGYHLAGTYTITATAGGTICTAAMVGSAVVAVGPLPTAFTVTGGGGYCSGGAGVDVGLAASNTGTNYQLYRGGVAVGGPVAGTGAPISFGLQTIAGTYTVVATNAATLCTNTMIGSVTVTTVPLPAAYTVSGSGSYCSGAAGYDVTLSSSDVGITYTLDSDGVADMTLAGTGSSLDFGHHLAGTYTIAASSGGTTCTTAMAGSATITLASIITPSVIITASPGTTVCAGTVVTFTATPSGGGAAPTYAWTVDGSSVGTGYTYVYTPADGDVVAVSLTSSAACATPATVSSSVIITISTPVVTASASSVSCDGSYTLTAGGGVSYTWTPSTGLSCAGCGSPIANPSATTTYTVMGTTALGCTGTATVSVDGNRIMGTISPSVSGSIEVWLIQFNPADSSISALDSQVACTSGGSQYYNFADPASGNYMVKAYLTGGTPGASGYIPTYGTSSAHWYSATGITHSSATDNMNITMIYGTVPSGSGFISGFVASGAGRGTSVPAPSVGMLIYLTDASGNVLTYTKTDGSGNYSFGSLANGTYIIYPEDYQYNTTASTPITLSSSSESVTGVDFQQFTTSMIIIPFDFSNTGVTPVTAKEGISVFPNPASDKLNISWENQTTGTANLVITDVLGREVYKSVMNINAASGTTQVGLQGIKDGIYLLTIKGENINYSAKVLIEE